MLYPQYGALRMARYTMLDLDTDNSQHNDTQHTPVDDTDSSSMGTTAYFLAMESSNTHCLGHLEDSSHTISGPLMPQPLLAYDPVQDDPIFPVSISLPAQPLVPLPEENPAGFSSFPSPGAQCPPTSGPGPVCLHLSGGNPLAMTTHPATIHQHPDS